MNDYLPILIFGGMVLGAGAGVVLAGLMCAAREEPDHSSRAEILGAYLLGYQDGVDGLPADTTRPGELYGRPI